MHSLLQKSDKLLEVLWAAEAKILCYLLKEVEGNAISQCLTIIPLLDTIASVTWKSLLAHHSIPYVKE